MPNLHVLEGGMNGWTAAGSLVRRGVQRLSLERQVRISAGALTAAGGALALVVHPLLAVVPILVGSGLVLAGATDRCAMAGVLSRLPYNRRGTCDVDVMIRALREGGAPPPSGGGTSALVGRPPRIA
jgi:hypothetical protein